MRFSAYNELFSDTKGADETLPSVASRVEDALARFKELRSATVKLAVGTRDYGINDLDNELALIMMLRALPREEYGDFSRPSATPAAALSSPCLAMPPFAPLPRRPARTSRASSAASAPATGTPRTTATRRTARTRKRRKPSRSAAPTETAARRAARTAPPPPPVRRPRRPTAPRSPSSPAAQVSASPARPTRTLTRTGSQTRALHLI
jgi:hypothetical protein